MLDYYSHHAADKPDVVESESDDEAFNEALADMNTDDWEPA